MLFENALCKVCRQPIVQCAPTSISPEPLASFGKVGQQICV
jgi:hypothetical protein